MGNQVHRIIKEDAVLVGIDFQERLMPAMKGGDDWKSPCKTD
jgi:hypothetical protein